MTSMRLMPSRSQMLDGLGDDAARHERLAQADLVRHEETLGLRLAVELLEDVLDRVALEVLEPAEDASAGRPPGS